MFLLLCNLNHSLIWVENVTFLQPSWYICKYTYMYGKWLIINNTSGATTTWRHGDWQHGNHETMRYRNTLIVTSLAPFIDATSP